MRKLTSFLTTLLLILALPAFAAAKAVTFSSETGTPGGTVTVAINVDDINAIAGYNIDFTYDSTVLSATSAASGAAFVGSLFIPNIATPGVVRLTLAGALGNTGTGLGQLATVTFSVDAAAFKSSPLTFTQTTLQGEAGELTGTTSTNGSVGITGVTTAVSLTPAATTNVVAGQAVTLTAAVTINGSAMTLTDGADVNFATSGTGTFGAKTLVGGNVVVDYTTPALIETATITVTENVTGNNNAGTATVTSVAGPLDSLGVLPNTANLTAGSTQQFTASGVDANGNPVTGGNFGAITWTVNGGIGTISATGLFTATTVGTGSVTATSSTGPTATTGDIVVTAGALATLTVNPNTANLTADQTQQFTVTGADASGNAIANLGTVAWSVVGTIGTVDNTGLFDATTPGTGTVKATVGAVSDSSGNITVTPGAVDHFAVAATRPTLASQGKGSATLTATLVDADGNVITTNNDTAFNFNVTAGGTFLGVNPATANTVNGVASTTVTTQGAAVPADTTATVQAVSAGLAGTPDSVTFNIVNFSIQVDAPAAPFFNPATGISLVTSGTPSTATLTGLGSATGDFRWALTGPGTLDSTTADTVHYTAPATLGADAQAIITLTSAADLTGTLVDTVTINLHNPLAVDDPVITPVIEAGASSQIFTATGGDGNFIWTVTGPVAVAGGTGGEFVFVAPDTGDFAGVYTITVTDGLGLTHSFTVKVPFTLDPATQSFTEVKLDNTANPQTLTVGGATSAGATLNLEILDSETAQNAVTNPADFGTFTAGATNLVNIFNPANVDVMAKFWLRITVTDDPDLTADNGLNKEVFGPFTILPVAEFVVTVTNAADGTALQDADVAADYPGAVAQVTGVNGEAVFLLPDAGGTFAYTVMADGFITRRVSSAAKTVAVALEPAGTETITGTVQDTNANALNGALVTAFQPATPAVSFQAVTDATGAFVLNLPVGAPLNGWAVVAKQNGFVSVRLNDQVTGTPVNFTGANGLQLKTTITNITATQVGETVRLDFTAAPAFADAGEATVALVAGTGTSFFDATAITGNIDAGATITSTYNAAESFKALIKADTSEDNDPTVGYAASMVFTHVQNEAGETSFSDCDEGGGTNNLIANNQTAMVNVPAGGVTKNATISVKQLPKQDANARTTQGSPAFVYEVNLTDADGNELADADIDRIEITLPIDLAVVEPGSLEAGTIQIFHAADQFALEANGGTPVPVANILAVDYVGDGLVGSVTFFVDHLSFFAVGTAAGGAAPAAGGGGGGSCFIDSAVSGSTGGSYLPLLAGLVVLLGALAIRVK